MRRSGRVGIGGLALAAIALVVLLASGCGYGGVQTAGTPSDPNGNGKAKFITQCGVCHTLKDAGTSGTIGPNLDNAFAGDVAEQYSKISIENVVLDQIRLGSGPILMQYKSGREFETPHCLNPATQKECLSQPMPANAVKGQDALDVAAYVAQVAGKDGYSGSGAPVGLDPASIFTSAGCAGCHTFAPAGAAGTAGPDLDTAIAADAQAHNMALEAFVEESIANPSAYLAHGFEHSAVLMPSFKGTLSAAQIKAVAQYIVSNTKK